MKIANKPSNETDRLKSLDRYNLMDTLPESELDDLTKLAAQICGTPIALISLLDEDRQWFKSKIGLSVSETSRDVAFCSHAILEPDNVLEVPNALEDDRFHDNPLVTDEDSHFRFYAGAPLKDPAGLPLGTLCVLDTKPRKMSGDQLESLKALSRQVISQFELRLQVRKQKEVNDLIKKAIIERERFLSNMSHEIRTPLNAIVSTVNLLKDESERGQIQEYIDILQFSSDNLMALVNDILDINKIESSKIKLEKAPVRIKELVRSLHASHSVRAEQKNIALHLYLDEKVPEVVMADSVRIAQVLNNLMSNAVKFTQEGEVKLEIEFKGIEKEKARIRFQISDTGEGMSEEQQKSLFQRFKQGDQSITRKHGGSGLGLFITKGLLKLMNAKITVRSEPGVGTAFTFDLLLPVYKELKSNSVKTEFDFGKLKGSVLLVDDNLLNQILATKFLEKWGLEVVAASNGAEAIEKARRDQYDLVLMDLQMPVMDGYTATQKIREIENGRYEKTPILAITASVLMEVKDKIHQHSMQDFISKPFTPKGLWDHVSKYLPAQEGEPVEHKVETVTLSDQKKDQLQQAVEEYTGGEPEFAIELVNSFILNFEDIRKEAIVAIEQQDLALYDEVVHKIKPSSIMLKYEEEYAELITIKSALELPDQTKNLEKLTGICDKILSELRIFKKEIESGK
jgi:signal transduction histidine kinase/DNA-binding NarL/FixJ family response regulator